MSKNGGGRKRIQVLRKRINGVDDKLLRLLFSRAGLAIEVGHVKRRNGLAAYSPAREREILKRLNKMNGGPLRRAAVKRIFRQIVRETRSAAIREVAK
jgi:chorismate mutase-like protein